MGCSISEEEDPTTLSPRRGNNNTHNETSPDRYRRRRSSAVDLLAEFQRKRNSVNEKTDPVAVPLPSAEVLAKVESRRKSGTCLASAEESTTLSKYKNLLLTVNALDEGDQLETHEEAMEEARRVSLIGQVMPTPPAASVENLHPKAAPPLHLQTLVVQQEQQQQHGSDPLESPASTPFALSKGVSGGSGSDFENTAGSPLGGSLRVLSPKTNPAGSSSPASPKELRCFSPAPELLKSFQQQQQQPKPEVAQVAHRQSIGGGSHLPPTPTNGIRSALKRQNSLNKYPLPAPSSSSTRNSSIVEQSLNNIPHQGGSPSLNSSGNRFNLPNLASEMSSGDFSPNSTMQQQQQSSIPPELKLDSNIGGTAGLTIISNKNSKRCSDASTSQGGMTFTSSNGATQTSNTPYDSQRPSLLLASGSLRQQQQQQNNNNSSGSYYPAPPAGWFPPPPPREISFDAEEDHHIFSASGTSSPKHGIHSSSYLPQQHRNSSSGGGGGGGGDYLPGMISPPPPPSSSGYSSQRQSLGGAESAEASLSRRVKFTESQ